MSWKKESVLEQKQQLVLDYLKADSSVTDLAEKFNISRKTAYKWINRFNEQGAAGLIEQSRARKNLEQIDPVIEHLIIDTRLRFNSWGAGKILAFLKLCDPDLKLPCRSVVNKYLGIHELLRSPKRKRKNYFPARSLQSYSQPNDTWCADYKGQIKLNSKTWSYPLTITDAYSKYILTIKSTPKIDHEQTRKEFEIVFKEYGCPKIIRTDNGYPFCSKSGLSYLSIWWIKHGIMPERISKGRPQENGSHERMHRTLKEYVQDKSMCDLVGQGMFDKFRYEYNELRPHAGNKDMPPSLSYEHSQREFRALQAEYPSGHILKRVVDGMIKLNKVNYYVTKLLDKDFVALKPVADGKWVVYYYFYRLGYIDEHRREFDK